MENTAKQKKYKLSKQITPEYLKSSKVYLGYKEYSIQGKLEDNANLENWFEKDIADRIRNTSIWNEISEKGRCQLNFKHNKEKITKCTLEFAFNSVEIDLSSLSQEAMNVANKMVQKERFKHEGLYEIYINIDGSSKYKLIETSYFDSKLDAEVYADSLASSMYAENPKKTREQIELETEHPGYDEEYADICNDKFWEYAHKFIKSKVKKVKKEKGE